MKNTPNLKGTFQVAEGVYGVKHLFVNSYMIKTGEQNNWVLVDTGLKWSAEKIKKRAENILGTQNPPQSIILTHGHFDHTGAVEQLAKEWNIPVYAHHLEIPYITGKASYPPADPTVGGGLVSALSFLYPNKPINIWNRVNILPIDGTIPGLPGWSYIHTPGHTPGHISLFRNVDKLLLAGDAFVTTQSESARAIFSNKISISGPPKYFTYDWVSSQNSIKTLFTMKPKIAATGHGQVLRGQNLKNALLNLTQNFNKMALPKKGRYLTNPAIADNYGIVYVPEQPAKNNKTTLIKTAVVTAGLLAAFIVKKQKRLQKQREMQYLLDFEYNF